MSDIDDFINEHNLHSKRKKQSKLTEYKDEIFQLKSMGFAEKVIIQFLAEKKNVHVSQQTLNQFIRSQSEPQHAHTKQTTSQAQNQPQERAQTVQATQPTPDPQNAPQQPETTPIRHAPRPLRKPTPTKRFDMSEKIDPETLK